MHIRSIVYSLGILLITGCSSFTENENTLENDIKEEYTTIEAILNPDSTVQLYLKEMPFLYSAHIYRNNILVDTIWNQVWHDTTPSSSNTEYRVIFNNDKNEVLYSSTLFPTVDSTLSPIGLIYPNKNSKPVAGQMQTVIWNPLSFPSDSVEIRARCISHYTPRADNMYNTDYIVPNNGMTSVFVKTELYPNQAFEINDNNQLVMTIRIMPHKTDNQHDYIYESQEILIYPPNYSDTFISPAQLDTAHIGTLFPITWKNNSMRAEHVLISVGNKDEISIVTPNSIENSGNYNWIVPNIPKGIYRMKLEYTDYVTQEKKMEIGFPFYIK